MKSKGTPFLNDGEYGNFLSLSQEALRVKAWPQLSLDAGNFPQALARLRDQPEMQSITFEVCVCRW